MACYPCRDGIASQRYLPEQARTGRLLTALAGFFPAAAVTLTLLSTPANAIDCTCRYLGSDYELGEKICLSGPSGPRVATCSMVLNNTSWNFTEAPCPFASLSVPGSGNNDNKSRADEALFPGSRREIERRIAVN